MRDIDQPFARCPHRRRCSVPAIRDMASAAPLSLGEAIELRTKITKAIDANDMLTAEEMLAAFLTFNFTKSVLVVRLEARCFDADVVRA